LHAAAWGGRDSALALLLRHAPWRWVMSHAPKYSHTLDAQAGGDMMTPLHCAALSTVGPAGVRAAAAAGRRGRCDQEPGRQNCVGASRQPGALRIGGVAARASADANPTAVPRAATACVCSRATQEAADLLRPPGAGV
jgi:hypothetical protein